MSIESEIAKDECAREPIHRPGAIQAHGALLVVDPTTELIVGYAGTLLRFANDDGELIARPLDQALGRPLTSYLQGHDLETATEPLYIGAIDHPDPCVGTLDILAHKSGGLVILEFEPSMVDRETAARLFTRLREAADRMRSCVSRAELFEAAADEVRSFTNFDRVMVYQFLDDESGSVVGEARNERYGSLLGHRFPAGDIPSQARALYLRNVIRVIPDATYDAQPIMGVPATIDLSDSSLRSVSPVHLQYLANMGVRASMSVSLVEGTQLWGLIACHSKCPLTVPYEVREACKYIAAELSRQIDRVAKQEEAELQRVLAREIDQWLTVLVASDDIEAGISANLASLAQALAADAVYIKVDTISFKHGVLLDKLSNERTFDVLREAFPSIVSEAILMDDLGAVVGDDGLHDVSACVILSSVAQGVNLMLARGRLPETVSWAGDPDNPYEIDGKTGRLGPRRSFEVWQRTQRGVAPAWRQAEQDGAEKVAVTLERLLRQARVAALQAELIQVSRVSAMGALASTLAHELNQPLTAISNFGKGVQLLLEEDPVANKSEAQRYLGQISSAAVRAGMIVKQLRAMVSKRPVEASAFSIDQAVKEALSLSLPDAHVRGIIIDIGSAGPGILAKGSIVQVEQVLSNLIRNAADAMQDSVEKRLNIDVHSSCDWVEVRVSDTGQGLPAEITAALFTAFNTSKTDGMGLGLSICRTIVERHGGQIWLERTGHPGTEFRLKLPRAA